MKKLFIIVAIALSLGGCADTKLGEFVSAVKTAASGSVSPEAIYIARNVFDTVEVSATNYLSLPRCPKQAPICREPSITPQLIAAVRSGRDARNAATVYLKQHPGELGSQGLYDALTTATSTIKTILARYNVGG